jgi:hypothetical protein
MPPQSTFEEFTDNASMASIQRSPCQKRKRTIRLRMEKNEIYPIPHIDDFDEDTIKAVWYEKTEYDTMKVGFVATIKKMMRGEPIAENNESTIRGLEFRTRKGALRRQHNKLAAITAVLDEQDRQFNDGTFDEERLAEIYRSSGSHCQESAQAMGLKDQEVMKDIVAEVPEPEVAETNKALEETKAFKRNMKAPESSRKTETKQIAIKKLFQQSRLQRRAALVDVHSDQRVTSPRAA